MISDARVPLHDLTAFERAVYHEVSGKVCQSPEAFAQLLRAVRYLVDNQIEGSFVECGVFRGASIVGMIRMLMSYGDIMVEFNRHIYLYDTFEGMPRPEPIDKFHSAREGEDLARWEACRIGEGSDWVRSSMDEVKGNLQALGYRGQLHFIPGMVEKTIPQVMPDSIALLRLDTDFYSSTKHELEHLYPRVVSGGVVIVDDYGAFRGSQQAVDEYIKEHGLKVLLARIDEHVRLWVKP